MVVQMNEKLVTVRGVMDCKSIMVLIILFVYTGAKMSMFFSL